MGLPVSLRPMGEERAEERARRSRRRSKSGYVAGASASLRGASLPGWRRSRCRRGLYSSSGNLHTGPPSDVEASCLAAAGGGGARGAGGGGRGYDCTYRIGHFSEG
jgi:hypothetical protein